MMRWQCLIRGNFGVVFRCKLSVAMVRTHSPRRVDLLAVMVTGTMIRICLEQLLRRGVVRTLEE